jgi:Zn-dependent protease with chaperone function
VTTFDAAYFDGRSSARTAVRVEAGDGTLHITGGGVDIEVALADIEVDARIGNTPRTLQLPGGAQLQTADHAALELLFPQANRFEAWVHGLERHWGMALASIVLIAGVAWWFSAYGIPLAANAVARALPQELEAKLGAQTLAALDASLCSASTLDATRQNSINALFGKLTAGDPTPYHLEFRACPRIGPNAYALPGGTIVVIDELVELAANDRQVAAVLAHEIGHVQKHHSLRLALQGAGVAALFSVLAGDAISITSLAVGLPTLLLQTGYSREFEAEADELGFARLKAAGMSPADFADIMTRLEDYQKKHAGGATAGDKGERALDYLSTHPDTAQRIERARNYR